jgi:hypothetical protein
MMAIEQRALPGYRWHVGCTILVVCASLAGCARRASPPQDAPSQPGRHRAALATVIVRNGTATLLTIAYRSAAPPVQEVVIGRAESGRSSRLAPVPAGEPIILIARRADGAQVELAARSFPLDAEWIWEIQPDAVFTRAAPTN